MWGMNEPVCRGNQIPVTCRIYCFVFVLVNIARCFDMWVNFVRGRFNSLVDNTQTIILLSIRKYAVMLAHVIHHDTYLVSRSQTLSSILFVGLVSNRQQSAVNNHLLVTWLIAFHVTRRYHRFSNYWTVFRIDYGPCDQGGLHAVVRSDKKAGVKMSPKPKKLKTSFYNKWMSCTKKESDPFGHK